eukprot:349893-Chlamydomonas_euryale.AAC.3
MEHTRVSPDGTLSSEEIDDLCHEFQQKTLLHPLIELRARYIRKHVPKNKGYQMLQVRRLARHSCGVCVLDGACAPPTHTHTHTHVRACPPSTKLMKH